MAATSITLDEETMARVRRLAAARQRSESGLIREAVAFYVEREEQRARLREDVQRAWDDYRATGRHVTAEDTDAWLARLEAGGDAAPPKCRD